MVSKIIEGTWCDRYFELTIKKEIIKSKIDHHFTESWKSCLDAEAGWLAVYAPLDRRKVTRYELHVHRSSDTWVRRSCS